jgi:hypothetical protein
MERGVFIRAQVFKSSVGGMSVRTSILNSARCTGVAWLTGLVGERVSRWLVHGWAANLVLAWLVGWLAAGWLMWKFGTVGTFSEFLGNFRFKVISSSAH